MPWAPWKRDEPLPSKGNAFDDLLSSKMAKMTMEERADGMQDLHGLATSETKMTLETIQRGMQDMDAALERKCMKRAAKDTEAFQRANVMNRPYVERLKLLFLQSHSCNAQDAADGLLRYFCRKIELFGDENLVKEIQLDNLGTGAVTVLRKGVLSLLTQRDRAGRVVFFMDGKQNNDSHDTKDVMRAAFYLVMTALQDEETLQKGMVIICYTNNQKVYVPGRSIEFMKTWESLPIKVPAAHYCMDRKEVHISIYFFCRLMENSKMSRFRVHSGTHVENIYKLMTFGIPKDALPVDYDGNMDPVSNNAMMKIFEKQANDNNGNSTPTTTDDSTQTTQENSHSSQTPEIIEDVSYLYQAASPSAVAEAVASTNDVSFMSSTGLNWKQSQAQLQLQQQNLMNSQAFLQTRSGGFAPDGGSAFAYPAATFDPNNNSQPTILTQNYSFIGAPCGGTSSAALPENEQQNMMMMQNPALFAVCAAGGTTSEPSNKRNVVLVPGPLDILMGRGRHPKNNAGALRMHHLVEEHRDAYDNSTRGEKSKLAEKLVRQLKASGVRFRTAVPGGYMECDDDVAREKVAHGFRNLRLKESGGDLKRKQRRAQKRGLEVEKGS